MRLRGVVARAVLVIGLWSLVACGVPSGDDDDATDGGDDDTVAFSSLYGDYFQNCKSCHTPEAPGRTSSTEQTLDFSTEDTALSTITTGSASGLVGNQSACNGVRFMGTTPETSLIVAVLDESVRQGFSVQDHPDCDADAISDMTLKTGVQPGDQFLADLKTWITEQNSSPAARVHP
jgi:mono/diheme cytochrome c family protein